MPSSYTNLQASTCKTVECNSCPISLEILPVQLTFFFKFSFKMHSSVLRAMLPLNSSVSDDMLLKCLLTKRHSLINYELQDHFSSLHDLQLFKLIECSLMHFKRAVIVTFFRDFSWNAALT